MKMKTTPFVETLTLDSTMLADAQFGLREINGGYLVCSPRIARTGIQEYLGIEMGRSDLEKVRVYRPEGEVFSKDALKTLAGKPVTLEHPDVPVTAENWRDLAIGHIGNDVLRDGEFIRVPLHLMDAKAIHEVKTGRSQLSVGYSAIIEWGDGVTPGGEKYHAKQTSIRANHVAITHTARGGDKLRMGDNDRRRTMATRSVQMDGITIEMEERDLQVVERRIAQLETEIATAKTALAGAQTTAHNDVATAQTALTTAQTLVQNKDAEIATLKKQLDDAKLTPEKIAAAGRERNAVVTRAKALLDSVIVTDDKSDADIRRQVVNAKMGELAKAWTDSDVLVSFNTLAVTDNGSGNGLQHAVGIIAANEFGSDPRGKAYEDYNNDISNRWKTAGGRVAQ